MMKKSKVPERVVQEGLPLGMSVETDDYMFEEEYQEKEVVSSTKKQKKTGKPRSHGRKKKGGNGFNEGFASFANCNEVSSGKISPVKTAKPNYKTKTSDASILESSSDIDDCATAGNDKYLPPPALQLQRQLSGSEKYFDYIDLSNNTTYDWDKYPYSIDKIIKKIDLSSNNLREIPTRFLMLPMLEAISFASNFIRRVNISCQMDHLSILEMPSNKIDSFPSSTALRMLPALRKLILFDNLIEEIPKDSVMALAAHGQIDEINISYNRLTSLPSQIQRLTTLSTFRLSKNKLTALPESIVALHFLDSNFSVFGNRLSYPPQEVAVQGFSAVKRFFFQRKQEEMSNAEIRKPQGMGHRKRSGSVDLSPEFVKSNQFKMIVVGHERAVYVNHMRQYGVVVGKPDPNKDTYEVELISICDNKEQPRNDLPESDWLPAKNSSTKLKKKVVHCRLDQLTLCRGDMSEKQDSSADEVAHAATLSTVGIDIDTWRPHLAHDFIRQYKKLNEPTSHSASTNSGPTEDNSTRRPYYSGLEAPMVGDGRWETEEATSLSQSSPLGGSLQLSRKKRRGRKKPSQTPLQDLVLSVWDFAGQEVYHAAQEAFFSERALYLVVWNMSHSSEEDMDMYVQFWIDLIQSRAPGSTIIVVGTHGDEISAQRDGHKPSGAHAPAKPSPDDLCKSLLDHIRKREASRIANLDHDRANAMKQGDSKQAAELGDLLDKRPEICPVFPVSCTMMTGFDELRSHIISLSTPTKANKNPFQLVDVYIPRLYLKVKERIEENRRAQNHVISVEQLQRDLCSTGQSESSPLDSTRKVHLQGRINMVRDAITFLSSIGEVVWFRSELAEDADNDKSNLESEFSSENISSHQSRESRPKCRRRTRSRGYSISDDESNDVDGSCWRRVGDFEARERSVGSISDMVFLSPHWLIDVLKSVLTHHLVAKVRHLKTSMSQNDLSRYFGHNHIEHAKNGIVKWSLIEEQLMTISVRATDSTAEDDPKSIKKKIISSLKTLMLKFNIIIRLDMVNDEEYGGDRSSKSHGNVRSLASSGSLKSDYSGEDMYFVVPAMIDSSEEPVIPAVAPSRSIKLEKLFRIENFVPPGLLQRIMSKTYFRYGNSSSSRQFITHNAKSFMHYQRSSRNCWKNAFLQTFRSKAYGEITVWVWLNRGGQSTQAHHHLGTKVDKSNYLEPKRHVETRGCIHIAVFGSIFARQEVVRKLHWYSAEVSDVLNSFRALCQVSQTTLCPGCCMQERRFDCGEFLQNDIAELQLELRKISNQKEERARELLTQLNSTNLPRDVSLEWEKKCRLRCPKHGCLVNPDFLCIIPPNLLHDSTRHSPLDEAQATIGFLMEEIVRLSSKPTKDVLNSVCKIGVGFCEKSRLREARSSIASGDTSVQGLHLTFNNKHLATGAILNIDTGRHHAACSTSDLLDENVFVVTCEHLFCDPATGKSRLNVPEGQDPVFLVGNQDDWLYIAELVLQGSDYPNGRERFASKLLSPPVGSQQYENMSSSGKTSKVSGMENKGRVSRSKLQLALKRQESSNSCNASVLGECLLPSHAPPNSYCTENKPPHEDWDVAAFKLVCKIVPTRDAKIVFDRNKKCETINKDNPESKLCGGKDDISISEPAGDLCSMFGADIIPEVEQTLRLISFQGENEFLFLILGYLIVSFKPAMPQSSIGTISICWGCINQIIHGQLLINFYSDYGTSGGAVVDREGDLVGLLSCSPSLNVRQSAFIEPLYPLLNLLRSDVWRNKNKSW